MGGWGGESWWHPLRPLPPPCSRRPHSPQSPAGCAPFVPPSAGRGGGKGWEGVVSRLPPAGTSNATLPDKSQLLLANGLSSCDSVLSGGGGPGSGRRISPAGGLAQVKGAEVFV